MLNDKIDFYVLDVKHLGNKFLLTISDKDNSNTIDVLVPIIGAKFLASDTMMELFTDKIIDKDIGVTENKLTYVSATPVTDIDLDKVRTVLKYIKQGYKVINDINDKFDKVEEDVKKKYSEYVDGLEEISEIFISDDANKNR